MNLCIKLNNVLRITENGRYTIYCKDGDNIKFSIDKGGEDTLAIYIDQNGYNEIR